MFCFVNGDRTATVPRPYRDRTATVRRPYGDRAATIRPRPRALVAETAPASRRGVPTYYYHCRSQVHLRSRCPCKNTSVVHACLIPNPPHKYACRAGRIRRPEPMSGTASNSRRRDSHASVPRNFLLEYPPDRPVGGLFNRKSPRR
jgi:hypothetical protein